MVKKHSPESIKKMRAAHKKNPSRHWKGKHLSEETKEKIRRKLKGKKLPKKTREKMKLNRVGMKGKKHTEVTKNKLRLNCYRATGKDHWNWKGGNSIRYGGIKKDEWDKIRKKVYERDNWICQICFKKCRKKGEIQCHHIIPWRVSQDNSMENLITLCNKDHIIEERRYYNAKEVR